MALSPIATSQGVDFGAIGRFVGAALAHFLADQEINRVEWKTRGHDHAPGLDKALLAHGFRPDEPESIMVGDARLLAVDVALPDGRDRCGRSPRSADIRAMAAMQDEVFGDSHRRRNAGAPLRRLAAR